jgi:hypothetical protein
MGFRNVYWSAFTLTALSGVCLWAGLAGYNLSVPDRLLMGTSWAQGVIWWEVWLGLAAMPFAAYFWRKAIQSATSSS